MEKTEQDYAATVAEIERIAQAHGLFAGGFGEPTFEAFTMRQFTDSEAGVSIEIGQDEGDGPITLCYLYPSKVNARLRLEDLRKINHEIYELIAN